MNNLNARLHRPRARTGRTSARASASRSIVFGNGKTAVKASVARYVATAPALAAAGTVDNNNPRRRSA